MCLISRVYDHFSPLFPNPADLFAPPSRPPPLDTPVIDWSQLPQLIIEFQKAVEAAKLLDRVLKQPDCADPEKAKLEARAAELERQLAELQRAAKPLTY